jgi:HK97 family phage portal protein
MRLGDFMPWRRKSKSVWDRWVELLDGRISAKSGQAVTLQSAMRVSAALACMRVLSQGVSQTPFKLFREEDADGLRRIRPARDHQVYDVVASRPNSWQTSFEFRETMVLHACMGNAYAFKNRYRGKVAELILLNPARVRPEQKDDWSITYKVSGKDGTQLELNQADVWHVRGPSWDGFLGLDTLNLAREALGLSLALEESHARLHANGVKPSGTYSVEGTLDPEQHTKLAAVLKKQAGAENAGAPLILDRNAKWLSTAMTGVDAQHKEVRDHQIAEVCRFFGVLPIMIGHTGDKSSTYASAEAMFTAHKVHSLDPWFTRIQESADLNLLTEEERKRGYYFKFNANGLLRGSSKDRAEYYAKALGAGGSPAWMTPDEVRALEELDPMGGDAALLPKPTNVPKKPSGEPDPEATP